MGQKERSSKHHHHHQNQTKNIIESINQIKLIDSLRKTLKGHKNWNLEREREKEREQVNSAILKSHTFIIIIKKPKNCDCECERESGREDFFLLLAFLIKEWRVNEIEREKEKGGLFGLGILWIIKIIQSSNHPKGISVSLFLFFVSDDSSLLSSMITSSSAGPYLG